ncbi:hypothetical protein CONLIGDRAFT_520682 [Coniochaeta ligniaria NRRL 30616]|uniref:Uncharacterized protein n=1 Tax=Coniochaeta ligniaria NRRL 30616 TaxID=1408157 RepID=A0A1J7JEX6_9PEZI|nr:hypothetical protein CONLIGDRAFT_520682 [Coniochaeta ligniaria NRRL 30616]
MPGFSALSHVTAGEDSQGKTRDGHQGPLVGLITGRPAKEGCLHSNHTVRSFSAGMCSTRTSCPPQCLGVGSMPLRTYAIVVRRRQVRLPSRMRESLSCLTMCSIQIEGTEQREIQNVKGIVCIKMGISRISPVFVNLTVDQPRHLHRCCVLPYCGTLPDRVKFNDCDPLYQFDVKGHFDPSITRMPVLLSLPSAHRRARLEWMRIPSILCHKQRFIEQNTRLVA